MDGFVALFMLERYVNGVLLQWERIQYDRAALPGPGPGVDSAGMHRLFMDIHFYFICYEKAQNLLKLLVEADGDILLCNIKDAFWPQFKPFNDARNHLEHIESRFEPKYLGDLGNMSDEYFTFGGERFDLSRKGLDLLIGAYEQIIGVISNRVREHRAGRN